MKKTTLITTLALSTLVLAGLAPAATAATSKSTTTEGKVIFKAVGDDDEGTVTKPDTEEEVIVPGEGSHTTGPLRITHVPDLDFGTVEIATKTTNVPAKFNTFKETDKTTGKPVGDAKEIAHFAQVEDVRGEKGDWQLTVNSTKFIPTKATNKPLEKSHIVLAEGKLFNTATASDKIGNLVNMLPANSPINNDGSALEIMSTKTGEHTDSSKTSVVFNNAYAADDVVGGVPLPEAGKDRLNPGVQLKTFGTDEKAVDDVYTATLTWTLTSAL